MSTDLLANLSEVSAERFSAGDDPAKRVARRLDEALLVDTRRLVFVVAPSGFGKTVACHRALAAHMAGGGFGLVLAHDHVERSASPPAVHERGLIRLAWLAPDLQIGMLEGRQKTGLCLEDLRFAQIPLCWDDQRRMLAG